MLKLKDLILESKKEMQDTDQQSVEVAVIDFFAKNKKSFEKLIDDEEWDDFYEKAFEKFPDADQDDVAQALNKAAMQAGFFESDETEMPTEKDLETMAFGEKSQQKGIKMGDYDKKMKAPKQSPTELYAENVKKKVNEAEYKGRKVKLNKPFYTPGGPRKRAVYVKNDKGNVVIVRFGEPGMKIKKSNPERRKSFRARHKCDTPGPKWKARWWSCKFW